jgi:thymidylate synthase (FAD)
MNEIKLLDLGYIKLIDAWGRLDLHSPVGDEAIIAAARMSTQKGFQGWGPKHSESCVPGLGGNYDDCSCGKTTPGDEKLLKYLYENQHNTPFEMAGMTIEVKAPIFVFREWHRHRTQSYNEMSARYTPLPDENYIPSVERLMINSKSNKQAGTVKDAEELTEDKARNFQHHLRCNYEESQELYEYALKMGIPKELARMMLPVGRYSKMRASANLRNWLAFMTLRCAPNAQWEIRQYADAVGNIVRQLFPRTMKLWIAH